MRFHRGRADGRRQILFGETDDADTHESIAPRDFGLDSGVSAVGQMD
jgi:hypothetical protein